jgi:predicted MFS family arabinose efflux permease
MTKPVNLVAAAFALTALSYGLARFAYGLLLPTISHDLGLSATAAGWIGGSAFAAYCVGIVFAFAFDTQLGARWIALLAGLTATVGLGLVSIAHSASALALAIALAGLSTGLTSPPLAVAVARSFDDKAQSKANGTINSGTAMGIVLSGGAVLALPGSWRELYAIFAVVGAVVTLWLWCAMPEQNSDRATRNLAIKQLVRNGAGGLCASAFLAGMASTAIWTFGADILREEYGFGDGPIAMAWIVLGAAGIVGMATGALTNRYGIRTIHRSFVSLMALALTGLAITNFYPPLGFLIMGLFGMAYIVSTGAFLLWGISLYEDRPALGLGLPFLVLALGQTAGAPLFGTMFDLAGGATALLSYATIMGTAVIWSAEVSDIAESKMPKPPSAPSA